MTSFLPVKLPCIMFHNPSGRIWLPPIMSYWGNQLHLKLRSSYPRLPLPTPVPKWSPQLKRQHPSPELQGSTSIDEATPRAMQEGPSSPKRQEASVWFASFKPSLCRSLSPGLQYRKGSQVMFLLQPPIPREVVLHGVGLVHLSHV